MGTVKAFLASEDGEQWREDFKGLRPGSKAFGEKWKEVDARDGVAFSDAQKIYLKRTLYNPNVRRVEEKWGLDLDSRSLALRNVVWATAVHERPGETSISKGVDAAEDYARRYDLPWASLAYDELVIDRIYEERIKRAEEKAATHEKKGQPGLARTSRNLAWKILPKQRRQAFQMLRRGR
jgi:hypothetical protein